MEWLRLPRDIEDFPSSFPRVSADVIYTPNSVRRQGWHVWGTILREFLDSRELIWRLIVRDISARYRQSILSYLWAILPSMATVAVFVLLKTSGTIPISETPVPYVAYALWGISLWQLFAGCLASSTGCLAAAGSLVTKVNFPKVALVFASAGSPIFDFVVRLVPLAVIFTSYGVPLKWQTIFMPFTLAPLILLALGVGFVMSVANLVLRDVGNALGIALTLGMFLTPVLYPPPFEWPFVLINIVNPASPLFIASQDLVAYGGLTMSAAFISSWIFSLLVFLAGWRFFNLALPRVSQFA
jgi:lipopolysaccharide transport system permease protein